MKLRLAVLAILLAASTSRAGGILTTGPGVTLRCTTTGQVMTWNVTSGTWTCSSASGDTGSGTANTTTKWTGTTTLGNGWALDDSTTWGVASKFTITESNGNFRSFGTGTIDGAATLSSGATIVGTATATTAFDAGGSPYTPSGVTTGAFVATGGNIAYTAARANSGSTGGPSFLFFRTRGADVATRATVANSDQLGRIQFDGDDGTGTQLTAQIAAVVNGTVATNQVPTDIVFYTSATNTSAIAEAFRLKSDQSALFGGQLDFGSHKGVNVTNGVGAQDVAAFGQIQSGIAADFTGNTNVLPKRTGTATYGDSHVSDDNTTVSVTAGGSVSAARFAVLGTSDSTYIMYGTNQDLYIRGGTASAAINIGDLTNTGGVALGSTTNATIAVGNVTLNNSTGTTLIKGALTENSTAHIVGALTEDGSSTLGDSTADTTTVNGSIVATNLPASQSVASGVNIANPNTAQTATGEVIYAHSNGSFNTTSGNLINYIVYAEAHATRSSGSNVLTNIAGFFDATSAQTNVAIYTGAGDVDLNQTSGVLNAHGAATLDSTLGVTGDTTVNKLTVNGKASDNSATINFTQTAQTLSLTALTLSNTGTFNTTGGVLTSSGGSFSVTSTRSSGANNLVNRAGYFNASGAQVNQGLYVDNGDVVLNNTSGTTLVTGHGSTTGDLRAADATAVSGTGVANQVLAVSRTGSSARSTTTAATLNDAINVAVSGAPTGSCVGHESNCGVLNRAIYATASGGDTAYSGYFDTGNFYVHGDTSFDAANFTVSGANETFGSTLANVSFTILSNGATYTFDNTHVDLNKNTTISAGNLTVTSGTATIGGAVTLSSTVSAAGTITASNGIAGNNGYGGKHLEWNDEWMGSTAQSAGFSTEDIGSPPYQILETGTGTGIADVTGVTQRPGIIQLITGTVSTGDVAVVTSPNSVNFGDGVWTWEQTVGWQTLSTGTQEYASLMGFFDTPSGVNQTDGCYFLYDRGNVATGGANGTNTHNLEAVCVSNGTRTVYLLNGSGNCDASFAKGTVTIAALTYPNTNIRRLKIVENSTSDVGFYADGTQVCKITTNIPTGSARLTGAGWAIIKSVGVTASTMDTDQTRLAVDLTSARSP